MATSYRPSTTTLNASVRLTGQVRGTNVDRIKDYVIKDVNEFSTFDVQVLNDDAPTDVWVNAIDDTKGA